MRIGRIVVLSLALGALAGGTFMVIVSILMMLVSGETLFPQAGVGVVAGMLGAGIHVYVEPARRGRGVLGAGFLACLAVPLALTGFRPFGIDFGVAAMYQALGVVLFAGACVATWHLCLRDIGKADRSRYQTEVLIIRTLKGAGFVFFTIIVALPFYIMVVTSLKSQQSLLADPLDLSIDFGAGLGVLFRSYDELFTQYHFGTFLMNSAIVSVFTVIITLFFSVPGAYAVARLRFPGQAVLSKSILLIYMVPAIVLVIPLYAVFSQVGLRNSLTGLLLVYPATTIPVAVYMLQGYFRSLPRELEEAGIMDGLSHLGVIAKIMLPLSLPALASVSLYIFMIAWNEFLFAFMFLDDVDLFTLSRGVMSLNSAEVPRQHLMAGAVVATVPVLGVFLIFERFLVAGLTAGSVKG
ncbi:MAG: carbohydrate ABC transporter permease [Inquilinaceae bacterium]